MEWLYFMSALAAGTLLGNGGILLALTLIDRFKRR